MSTHDHDAHNLQPEDSGVKPQPILMFLVILTVSTAAVFIIIKGVLWGLNKAESSFPQTPATLVRGPGSRSLPPEPRLQGAEMPDPKDPNRVIPSELPLDDMKTYTKTINDKVNGFGWVNKEAGVAHISIERAKEIIAEKGLPLSPEIRVTEVEKAAAARRLVLNAVSSGGQNLPK
jgi:hypothetical protein